MVKQYRAELPLSIAEEMLCNILGSYMGDEDEAVLVIKGEGGYKTQHKVEKTKKKNYTTIVKNLIAKGLQTEWSSDEEEESNEIVDKDIEIMVGEGKKKKLTTGQKAYVQALKDGKKPSLEQFIKGSGSDKTEKVQVAKKNALEFLMR